MQIVGNVLLVLGIDMILGLGHLDLSLNELSLCPLLGEPFRTSIWRVEMTLEPCLLCL